MSTQFYLLRPFTNLHVGSGETNFGVIDNLIERDSTTGFPCINSSGIKGAIKQMLHYENITSDDLKKIFGSDTDRNKGDSVSGKKYQQGESFFLSAQLLAIPVRSNKTPFVLATCPQIIRHFLKFWKDLNNTDHAKKESLDNFINLNPTKGNAYCLKQEITDRNLGGMDINMVSAPNTFIDSKNIVSVFGNTEHPIAIISDENMIELCDDLNLPVIARNVLEDGESKNLWYEQVLPRESLLYFAIIWGSNNQSIADDHILKKPLQLGGNASVGYGFTRINEMT